MLIIFGSGFIFLGENREQWAIHAVIKKRYNKRNKYMRRIKTELLYCLVIFKIKIWLVIV